MVAASMGAVMMAAMLGITSAAPTVDFDSRSFVLDGKPDLLLSGVVHYARVLPADWNRTFSLMTEMGLNTVQVNHSLAASQLCLLASVFSLAARLPRGVAFTLIIRSLLLSLLQTLLSSTITVTHSLPSPQCEHTTPRLLRFLPTDVCDVELPRARPRQACVERSSRRRTFPQNRPSPRPQRRRPHRPLRLRRILLRRHPSLATCSRQRAVLSLLRSGVDARIHQICEVCCGGAHVEEMSAPTRRQRRHAPNRERVERSQCGSARLPPPDSRRRSQHHHHGPVEFVPRRGRLHGSQPRARSPRGWQGSRDLHH